MIDYELAKELKDAGFSQEPFWSNYGEMVYYGGSWYYIPVKEGCPQIVFAGGDDYKKGLDRGDELIKMPALSELIEAFEGKFFSLQKGNIEGMEWIALGVGNYGAETGKTPEESVARLWLWFALQKKRDADNS